MKKFNVKWKIIIWHSTVLLSLFIITLPIMYLFISHYLYTDVENKLISKADQAQKALQSGEGLDEPNTSLDIVQTSYYVILYSSENNMISGRSPQGFSTESPPDYGDAYYIKSAGHKWIVIDRKLNVNGLNNSWFRIIKSVDTIAYALAYFRAMIYIIIPIYTLLSALTMVSGGFITRALSPVKQITKTARQIEQGDFTKRINFDGAHDELGVLANTFDQMLDRLEDSLGREKRFSSDVSHELRTPVAAIIVNAEEALDGEKTTEEYKENLNAILLEAKKMNTLISQLLMMARSINGKYSQDLEIIDLSILTGTIVDEISERDSHPDVTITSYVEDGIIMRIDQTLYMRLLYNLIDNATKYNVSGGWIKVSLQKSENDVLLSVADGGIGISEEALPKICNRFFKVDQSSASSSPGLGLSIVKWIAEQFGGTVSVESQLGKGSVFEVRFPISNMQ